MKPSFARLFAIATLGLLLVLGAASYFLFQLSLNQPQPSQLPDLSQNKIALREQLRRFEVRVRHLAKNIATHPLTITAMQKNNERERLSQTALVQSFYAEAKNIQLLPLEDNLLKNGALMLANPAYSKFTGKGYQAYPFSLKSTASAELLLTTVYPILDPANQSLLGYVILEMSMEELQQIFSYLPSSGMYVELQQTGANNEVTVLLKRGDENLKLRTKPELLEINNDWRLAHWTAPAAARFKNVPNSAYSSDFMLILVFTMIIMILFMLGLYVYLQRLVKNDLNSFLRLLTDMRRQRLRRVYPVKLKEFEETAGIMYKLGKLMMGKQRQFADIASTDHLSQVHNRRSFEIKQQQLFKTVLEGWAHSLLILDIDNFKDVNDVHGHEAGDALIVQFGKALKDHLRSSDFVARLGGDEFCVIFPNTPLRKAIELSERLRKNMPDVLDLGGGISHQLRWSGGLSEYHKDDKADNAALSRADVALLDAKRSGRNRTEVRAAPQTLAQRG